MIAGVSALGCTSVLLTGDGQETAEAIAERLGIREIRANCLPEEKLRQIELLQTEGAGVCMISALGGQ
jgi:P-type E1-E2 ATPase